MRRYCQGTQSDRQSGNLQHRIAVSINPSAAHYCGQFRWSSPRMSGREPAGLGVEYRSRQTLVLAANRPRTLLREHVQNTTLVERGECFELDRKITDRSPALRSIPDRARGPLPGAQQTRRRGNGRWEDFEYFQLRRLVYVRANAASRTPP